MLGLPGKQANKAKITIVARLIRVARLITKTRMKQGLLGGHQWAATRITRVIKVATMTRRTVAVSGAASRREQVREKDPYRKRRLSCRRSRRTSRAGRACAAMRRDSLERRQAINSGDCVFKYGERVHHHGGFEVVFGSVDTLRTLKHTMHARKRR